MKVHNIPSLNPLQLFRSPFQQHQAGRAAPRQEQRGPIPKVPSLLFEIELEEAPVRPDVHEDVETQGVLINFRTLAVPWSKTEHELLAQWNAAHEVSHGSKQSLDALAACLCSPGHPVSIRTALGGGWGGECLRNLRHSFLVCTVSGQEGMATYIIDPAFREQFSIAHPTPRYEQILAAIPATFVGREERLVALVKALCAEIQAVFLQQNATLPPWRDVSAQLSKWRPRRSMDCPVTHQKEAVKPPPHRSLSLTARTGSGEWRDPARGEEPSLLLNPGGLARTSAPIPLPGGPEGGASSKGKLYQRMAGPVQHLVSRSCTQSGLLALGL